MGLHFQVALVYSTCRQLHFQVALVYLACRQLHFQVALVYGSNHATECSIRKTATMVTGRSLSSRVGNLDACHDPVDLGRLSGVSKSAHTGRTWRDGTDMEGRGRLGIPNMVLGIPKCVLVFQTTKWYFELTSCYSK